MAQRGASSRSGAAAPPSPVASPEPAALPPARIARELTVLLDEGALLRPAGTARRSPARLLRTYPARHRVDLFGFRFYLTDVRQNPTIRFFVAYVMPPRSDGAAAFVYPRLFYKDVSLVWRVASHFVRSDGAVWIGKGETRARREAGALVVESQESTTDLPLELQAALDVLSRRATQVPTDHAAIARILRQGPPHRIEAYADFSEPRRRAREQRGARIHGGRSVARFTRKNDPTSLVFAPGFEPDFGRTGVFERTTSKSRLYGGRLARYRILSRNRRIQYLFFAGPRHVWIAPPQTTTEELTSYGVRTLDVEADEDLFVPGFEYHFYDDGEDPPALVSQIPPGFAGDVSPVDDMRADASAWLDRLPVIRTFRQRVLGAPKR